MHRRGGSCGSQRSRLHASALRSTFHQKNTHVLKHLFPNHFCCRRWALQFYAQARYLGASPEKKRFKLCTGAGVREGRDRPARVSAPPAQLSSEKHICFEATSFVFLSTASNHTVFTSQSGPHHGSDFRLRRLNRLQARSGSAPPRVKVMRRRGER